MNIGHGRIKKKKKGIINESNLTQGKSGKIMYSFIRYLQVLFLASFF
jgi:hypothetical protein